ncbi:hypothetical protein ETD86_30110 [Nonomuraea turkmeniaca]|uniref:CBM-cenC domain-containing protein n=1 Tax=Nonomuraea turkmeniaca TaxID=103838 RepID=A0A5S4FAX1_9ACTN|nr:carbohydrate binding domain-containing protein [Nonomuraea turkmeniaca]TMR13821.1 hypothetical protein ETD86_30110 [Nonomuraea turkmeniaca]
MRRLTAARLPVIAATPAPPTQGEVVLYPCPDGKLRQLTHEGNVGVLAPSTRTALTSDFVHTNIGYWEEVPGLSIPVPPGLHRLNLHVDITGGLGTWYDVRLMGPATAAPGPLTVLTVDADGWPWRNVTYAGWGEDLLGTTNMGTVAAAEGLILAREPSVISLEAALIYFANPATFEDFLQWSLSGADIDIESTDFVHSGTYAGKITAQDDGRAVIYNWLDIAPASTWHLSGWIYSPTGHPRCGVSISWYDANDQQIADAADLRPLPAGQWTQFVLDVVAPDNAAQMYVQVGMEVSDGHGAGSAVYVDDVMWRITTAEMRVRAGTYVQVTPV